MAMAIIEQSQMTQKDVSKTCGIIYMGKDND